MSHIDEKLKTINDEVKASVRLVWKGLLVTQPKLSDDIKIEEDVVEEMTMLFDLTIRRLLEEQEKELFEAQNLIAELWVRILTSILPHESTQTLDFIEDKLEAYVTSIASTTDKLHVSK